MKEKIIIIIADDHPIFRKGLKYTIQTNENFEIIGEAVNGQAAIELIEKLSPDVAVLDVEMPFHNGLAVAEIVLSKNADLKIILLTAHKEPEVLKKAVKIGVKGYLLKDSVDEEIVKAIEVVNNGGMYISPIMSGYLVGKTDDEMPIHPLFNQLTQMEHKIIQSVAHNKSTAEIADQFCISERTVDRHRSNICKKLNLTGNNALTKFALENREILLMDAK